MPGSLRKNSELSSHQVSMLWSCGVPGSLRKKSELSSCDWGAFPHSSSTHRIQQFVKWTTAFLLALTHFQFQTVLFAAWFSSDGQAALRAIWVPQSPSGLGALLGLRRQVPVRRHVCLRGPTHAHSSKVFGYAVVLSHLEKGRRRPWFFLKYIIKDTMNSVNALGLPWMAKERWPWRVACCMLRVAEHQACSVPVKYGLLFSGNDLTQRGPTQESLHEVSTDPRRVRPKTGPADEGDQPENWRAPT